MWFSSASASYPRSVGGVYDWYRSSWIIASVMQSLQRIDPSIWYAMGGAGASLSWLLIAQPPVRESVQRWSICCRPVGVLVIVTYLFYHIFKRLSSR